MDGWMDAKWMDTWITNGLTGYNGCKIVILDNAKSKTKSTADSTVTVATNSTSGKCNT